MSKKIKYLLQREAESSSSSSSSTTGTTTTTTNTNEGKIIRNNNNTNALTRRKSSSRRLKSQKIKNIKSLVDLKQQQQQNRSHNDPSTLINSSRLDFEGKQIKQNEPEKYISKIFESIAFKEQQQQRSMGIMSNELSQTNTTENKKPVMRRKPRRATKPQIRGLQQQQQQQRRVNKIKHLIEPGRIDHSTRLISKIFQNTDMPTSRNQAKISSFINNNNNNNNQIYSRIITTINEQHQQQQQQQQIELVLSQQQQQQQQQQHQQSAIMINQQAISAIMIR